MTGDSLNNDHVIARHIRENDGWMRLELLSHCNKVSYYGYDTILAALTSNHSNKIELSPFEPRCIRRRSQTLIRDGIQDNQTIIVMGLPLDAKYEELIEFFNRFYPVTDINMFPYSNAYDGTVFLVFKRPQDVLTFVSQSKLEPIVYVRNSLYGPRDRYTLVCKLLNDNMNTSATKQNTQLNFMKGRTINFVNL